MMTFRCVARTRSTPSYSLFSATRRVLMVPLLGCLLAHLPAYAVQPGPSGQYVDRIGDVPVPVVAARFGLFRGQQGFEEDPVVPLVPGTRFGWCIALGGPVVPQMVTWREVLTLPVAAPDWRKLRSHVQRLSADHRSIITLRRARVIDGQVCNSWSTTDDDTPGAYLLQVQLPGSRRQFAFNVVADSRTKARD